MTAPTTTAPSVPVRLLVLAAAGAAVAVHLGVYADGGMPSFEGCLTEQQITAVVDYTRTL